MVELLQIGYTWSLSDLCLVAFFLVVESLTRFPLAKRVSGAVGEGMGVCWCYMTGGRRGGAAKMVVGILFSSSEEERGCEGGGRQPLNMIKIKYFKDSKIHRYEPME